MQIVKKEQEKMCQFIDVDYIVFGKINGKTRPIKHEKTTGLQIKNKIYLPDGKYKFVNNKNLKITNKYDDIPDGMPEELKQRYKENKED